MGTAKRSTGSRLPISCQACRARKIRCTRDGRPCQTCARRGLGAKDCIYLGQPRLSPQHVQTAALSENSRITAHIDGLRESAAQRYQSKAGGTVLPQESAAETENGTEVDPPSDHELRVIKSCLSYNTGALQTLNGGYVRYSPWGFSPPLAEHGPEPDIDNEIVDEDELNILFSRVNVSRGELLAVLPPRQYCDALKDIYFHVFSPLFHLLHDPTFETEYQRYHHETSSVTLSWLALLYAILSLAVTALGNEPLLSDLGREKTVGRNIKILSARYRSASLQCLAADHILSRHSIHSLQSLILVNYARINRGLPVWSLLGFTRHVAISMGCHVDPSRFSLGLVEQEERRRAWFGLSSLFSVQNTLLSYAHDCSIPSGMNLPLESNDVDLLTGRISRQLLGPTEITYFLLEFQLRKILSILCKNLFEDHPESYLYQTQAQILGFRDMCNQRYQPRESLSTPYELSFNILHSNIHHLLLLLLRPHFCVYIQGQFTSETYKSWVESVSSARATLAIHKILHDSSQYDSYKWYTGYLGSFYAFHAAVVLSVSLIYPENKLEYDNSVDSLWGTLKRFAALSNRSSFCSKAVPALRYIIETACTYGQRALASLVSLDPNASGTTNLCGVLDLFSPDQDVADRFIQLLQPQHWVSPTAIPWRMFKEEAWIHEATGLGRLEGLTTIRC